MVSLVAKEGSLVASCLEARPDLDKDTIRRLALLEKYDFGFLLLGLSPRRLLNEGRIFDNEQVLPLLLWFGQWDKHCRYWASEIARQWTVFNPSETDGFEGVDNEKATAFRDYFQKKYVIPLIEEFREFAAFSKDIWLGAPHMPPEVPEEPKHDLDAISSLLKNSSPTG